MRRSGRDESPPKGGHPPSRSHPAASGLPSPQGLRPSACGLTPNRAAPEALRATNQARAPGTAYFVLLTLRYAQRGYAPLDSPGSQPHRLGHDWKLVDARRPRFYAKKEDRQRPVPPGGPSSVKETRQSPSQQRPRAHRPQKQLAN